MLYSQNSILDLKTITGSINVDIFQYVDMGANITGSMNTTTGSIDVDYVDNQSSVGAGFSKTSTTGSYTSTNSGGFTANNSDPFESLDYTSATSTYTLSLKTTTGGINIDGTSLVVV